MVLQVLAALASPFGINKLLQYIETEGKDATYKPWVWILWLLFAPILGSVVLQWHYYLGVSMAFLHLG